MSYNLKTVEQESLYSDVAFSPSGLPQPNMSKMSISDFSPVMGVFLKPGC